MLSQAPAIRMVLLHPQAPIPTLPVLEGKSPLLTGAPSALYPGHVPRCSLQPAGPECSVPEAGGAGSGGNMNPNRLTVHPQHRCTCPVLHS